MSLFERDENAGKLARAQVLGIHKGAQLFVDQLEGAKQVNRFELPYFTLNYIFSNKYAGEGSGVPMGKIINTFGWESSGKSALWLNIASAIIAGGGKVLWVDAERSLDAEYAMNFGIDIEDEESFIWTLPDYGEQAMDIVETYVSTGAIDLAVIDSVTALQVKKVFEATSEKNDVASLANKLSPHLGKMVKMAADNHCTVVYINQMRTNLTAMGAFGNKYTGGAPMKFYPHIALNFKERSEIYKGDKEFVGLDVKMIAEKNKTAKPKNSGSMMLVPGFGFSKEVDVLTHAEAEKVVRKAGNFYYFATGEFTEKKVKGVIKQEPVEILLGNGKDAARQTLVDDPELFERIRSLTAAKLTAEVDTETGEILEPETEVAEAAA